jgi:hypothetical protein
MISHKLINDSSILQRRIFGSRRSITNLRNKHMDKDFQMFNFVNFIFELQVDLNEILAT